MTQTERVINMLREGPKTNVDFVMAGILKYTSRISDARKMGCQIEQMPHGKEGTRTYRLVNMTIEDIAGLQQPLGVTQ